MEDAETVAADQVLETAVEEAQEVAEQEAQNEPSEESKESTTVPLSALQKERKKRQEAELRAQFLEEQARKSQQPKADDLDDKYESVTKGDLGQVESEFLRKVEERSWVRSHPDRYEYVNEKLPELLKRKPNLAYAIASAENRYEEAWSLLKAFEGGASPAQVKGNTAPARRAAPNSPSGTAKAAGVNQAVDVMNMSDNEFRQWREAKRRRR